MSIIAFQGEHGAYSEIASLKYFGDKVKLSPSFSIDLVFNKVKTGKADFGVVPVENSSFGSIFETYDYLSKYDLFITGELNLQVNHYLLAEKKYKLDEIKKVYSHPQALGQSSEFLKTLKNAKIHPAYDTAGSAIISGPEKGEPVAIVASKNAAAIYGLKILKANIQNNKENYTRFLVISKKSNKQKIASPKSSICFELQNVPGSLFKALSIFALRDINLAKIESRPIPQKPFQYVFYVDLYADLSEQKIKNAINHLEEIAVSVKKFGAYETGKIFRS